MGNEIVNLAEKRALRAIQDGLQLAWKGEFEEAREQFQASAKQYLSAEALTYWGWMEFQLGDLEQALELCHQAIEIDPDFGNPYNDIGSYLVTQGQPDEAIPWFEKAILSKRYEARHYPHINLGRVFLKKDQPLRALREFKRALELSPGDPALIEAVRSITETLN